MKYDFTTVIDRRGKDSIAADVVPIKGAKVKEGLMPIPMWIADMGFATAPAVQDAIAKRMEHPMILPLSTASFMKNSVKSLPVA